jgi:hypothetical protein
MRSIATTISVLLAIAGIASAVLVHWLIGLSWIELDAPPHLTMASRR